MLNNIKVVSLLAMLGVTSVAGAQTMAKDSGGFAGVRTVVSGYTTYQLKADNKEEAGVDTASNGATFNGSPIGIYGGFQAENFRVYGEYLYSNSFNSVFTNTINLAADYLHTLAPGVRAGVGVVLGFNMYGGETGYQLYGSNWGIGTGPTAVEKISDSSNLTGGLEAVLIHTVSDVVDIELNVRSSMSLTSIKDAKVTDVNGVSYEFAQESAPQLQVSLGAAYRF